MAIPPLNEHGWLPEGIHDCTLEEAAARFGGFQRSDRRPQLWARCVEFVREAQANGLIDAVIVDGSFVTAEPLPGSAEIPVYPVHGINLYLGTTRGRSTRVPQR